MDIKQALTKLDEKWEGTPHNLLYTKHELLRGKKTIDDLNVRLNAQEKRDLREAFSNFRKAKERRLIDTTT